MYVQHVYTESLAMPRAAARRAEKREQRIEREGERERLGPWRPFKCLNKRAIILTRSRDLRGVLSFGAPSQPFLSASAARARVLYRAASLPYRLLSASGEARSPFVWAESFRWVCALWSSDICIVYEGERGLMLYFAMN